MGDMSFRDQKYFVSSTVYNCPFCNRRHVAYRLIRSLEFDWSQKKRCYGFVIQCSSCNYRSLHLSFEEIGSLNDLAKFDAELDSVIFYSHPTSFFVLDARIPKVVREHMSEAEGCLKMNFLTGASACARKAIYELLLANGVAESGEHYEERIKALKKKHPSVDPTLIDTLAMIQGLTSDKVHEGSWERWDADHLKLVLETLRAILVDMYVVPAERMDRAKKVAELSSAVKKGKADRPPTPS